jgi:hypothetical protein
LHGRLNNQALIKVFLYILPSIVSQAVLIAGWPSLHYRKQQD